MGAPSMAVKAKLGIGDTGTVDKPLEFSTENVRKIPLVKDTGGIRGILSAIDERAVDSTYTVSGQVTLPGPSPAELDSILYYLTGSVKTAGTFPLVDTAKPSFYLVKDAVAKVFSFAGCKMSKGTFRSQQGGFLEVLLDIEGLTASVGNAGTFPGLTLDTGPPYQFHHCVFTIGGSSKDINDIEIVVDNALKLDVHRNNQARTSLPEGERIVTCKTTTPFTSDEVALYTTGAVAVVATFTNGNYSLGLSMPAVRFAAETPSISGLNNEITLGLQGRARKTGSSLELLISNDSTP